MNKFQPKKSCEVLFLLAIILSGCGPKTGSWVTQSTDIEGVWHFIGDYENENDLSKMSMIFESGGTLHFSVGFEYHNPAFWEYNPAENLLKIKISNVDSTVVKDFQERIVRGEVVEFSAESKELTYKINPKRPSLLFRGWYFAKHGRLG